MQLGLVGGRAQKLSNLSGLGQGLAFLSLIPALWLVMDTAEGSESFRKILCLCGCSVRGDGVGLLLEALDVRGCQMQAGGE